MREKPFAVQAASAVSALSVNSAVPSAVTEIRSAAKPFIARPPSVW
ncbi:hypothetical protein SHIRM173S_06780 [Streptomyces hirsutus]